MPYKEFKEWAAYFSVERANYSQTDVNIAQLVVMKSGGKIKLNDILPKAKFSNKKQKPDEIMAGFKMINSVINANSKK